MFNPTTDISTKSFLCYLKYKKKSQFFFPLSFPFLQKQEVKIVNLSLTQNDIQIYNILIVEFSKMKKEEPQRRSPSFHPSFLQSSTMLTPEISDFIHHPGFLVPTMESITSRPSIGRDRKLKWLSFAALCHPVLIPFIQNSLEAICEKKGIYEDLQCYESLVSIMESINILCQIKGFSYSVLKVKARPDFQNDSYGEGLWANCLPILSQGKHYKQCEELLVRVDEGVVNLIRQFLAKVHLFKEEVSEKTKLLYDSHQSFSRIHLIDMKLAQNNGLLTLNYFPENYQRQYIEIWIDRTVQLNSLLGNFVCKERFGQFQYVKGPLAHAMEKGILLVLNNFQQISNELLVSIRTLSEQKKIFHNQKTFEMRGGFCIVGICKSKKPSKMKEIIHRTIAHSSLKNKSVVEEIPAIQNQTNYNYLHQNLICHEKTYGQLSAYKLWRRIIRSRKNLINCDSTDLDKMWNSYFTESFVESVNLQIQELTNKINANRMIQFEQQYKRVKIGRASLEVTGQTTNRIVKTHYSLSILERLGICIELDQTPLLISQTGCGKTTLVQYLAELGSHRLYVYNMSSGTDAMDLVGGFKPIDCRVLLKELFFKFIGEFQKIPGVSSAKNEQFVKNLTYLYQTNQLKNLLNSLVTSIEKIQKEKGSIMDVSQFSEMLGRFKNIRANLDRIDSNLVFSFIEGNLIRAIKNGDWVLIDEINLASNDVLQKIVPLMEGKSLLLYEKGDLTYIKRHPDFRIIACMNPANDSGKKPLPPLLMEKMTVIYLQEPTVLDVQLMVKEITPQLNPRQISDIYFKVKKQSTISLRNLSRCLAYINRNSRAYTFKRALYDGLVLGFHAKALLKSFEDRTVPRPMQGFVQINGFLIEKGQFTSEQPRQIFHLTNTFHEHLKDFLRAISGTELPVLLEGPTSAGKTSIIRYVAQETNHKCLRINNHEHTEIEQYLGNYYPNKDGKLVFREGPLVQAVKEGYWLILDELNLARTEILECLNRLLDDNRQLFIPEQQKHIKPHPHFRIFATQNPASYSGRKTLSRAFRNRFVSLSFENITVEDTMAIMKARREILSQSQHLASYVKKNLESLSEYRQRQRVFSKDGLITIRDLLKWTGREFIDKDNFMRDGFALLGERLRTEEEKKYVQKILTSGNSIQLNMDHEYEETVKKYLPEGVLSQSKVYVQMNKSFIRMAALTIKAIVNKQPVLLVGETGCGKTTLAQLLAEVLKKPFYSINCHKHTEASDFLGSLRPCTNPNSSVKFEYVNGVVIDAMLSGGLLLIDEINTAEDSVLERLNQLLESNDIGVQRGQGWQTISAKAGFCLIATMNPSGDFGKKQLSPALRNRFTEIWVQPITHPQYIQHAQQDIKTMIQHKLSLVPPKQQLSNFIYAFVKKYNCQLVSKYGIMNKFLTMRDIGWICKFVLESQGSWEQRYYWSLRILAIEGINFMSNQSIEQYKLTQLSKQLITYINSQVSAVQEQHELTIFQMVKNLTFPLMIKTDLPLELLGLHPDDRIFFSPHTELSDLLGQFQPQGQQFVWHDQTLLSMVKNGGRLALVDLNLAQQPVIEGINSLFDHRGSIFVVELNQTFNKAPNFRPVVVLQESSGTNRRGLPNSFLNRFLKIRIRDVSHHTKQSYLLKKYPLVENHHPIITHILNNHNFTLPQLELICQLLPNHTHQTLQLLNISHSHPSPNYYQHQQHLLTLFPLHKQLHIDSPQLIDSIMKCYLVYEESDSSICLVGEMKIRERIVQMLSYVMGKPYVKIILSTMSDAADLLGSYEQVADDDTQTDKGVKFQYVQSRIMEALSNSESNILFIDVPNKQILERVQKGLKPVYNKEKQIILGLSQLHDKPPQTKLFYQRIPPSEQPLPPTDEYYQPNYSNLKQFDKQHRQAETYHWINTQMEQENKREVVRAWRKLYTFLVEPSAITPDTHYSELYEEQKSTMPMQYIQNLQQEQLYQHVLLPLLSLPHDETQYSHKLKIHNLLHKTHNNPLLSLLGKQQQQTTKQIQKFQSLYISNMNNFASHATQLLKVLYKHPNTQLLHKFLQELQPLHEQLSTQYIHQILVEFSDEEYRMVPILNTLQHVRLQLMQYWSVGQLVGETVSMQDVVGADEGKVLGMVERIITDVPDIAQWYATLQVRNIQVYNLVERKLQYIHTLLPQIKQLKPIAQRLLHSIPITNTLSHSLYHLYRPHPHLPTNLSYHLKTTIQHNTLLHLLTHMQHYQQTYHKLCSHKYNHYHPHSYTIIEQQTITYHQQYQHIKQHYIYRQHNNLNSLINFYQQLLSYCQQVEEKEFSYESIVEMIRQTYKYYYYSYKDVLYPIYVSLLLMLEEEPEKMESMELVRKQSMSMGHILSVMMEKQEQEGLDRAKQYLKYQRKFKKQVIIDEYTEQGVQKHKANDEEQFNDLFLHQPTENTILDDIYLQVRKPHSQYCRMLLQHMLQNCRTYPQLIICKQLMYTKTPYQHIHLYDDHHLQLIYQLTVPINNILLQLQQILKQYNIASVRTLATLCNKIHEHRVSDQVYKVLIDCEQLADKIILEVNPILPKTLHIDSSFLVRECLRLRRMQLKNWPQMLEKKLSRVEKSDTVEFINFYHQIMEVGGAGESASIQTEEYFRLTDNYLLNSKFSCVEYRLHLLGVLVDECKSTLMKRAILRVMGFYKSLRQELTKQWDQTKKAKLEEMKQYERLAGWDNNDYLIFKATCTKFQNKIHRILKSYEEQLSIPLKQLQNELRARYVCKSIADFDTTHALPPATHTNQFQDTVIRLFQTIKQLQSEHHNTQSRMRVIKEGIEELEDVVRELYEEEGVKGTHNSEGKYICEEMFEQEENYQRAVKYYYGIWDKLAQRTQSAWNQDVVDKVWGICSKIWHIVNAKIPQFDASLQSSLDPTTENILTLFQTHLCHEFQIHPLMKKQLQIVRSYLTEQKQSYQNKLAIKYQKIVHETQIVSLMKLGYIIGSIALNLEKNGLCVKPEQQQRQKEQNQELVDGMGIGEGQAHEGAQNVGDQIQFEEQVQGEKGEQKNQNKNAENQEDNDIQMEGNFQGDMYDKKEKSQGNESEEQQEGDEEMGSVDNEKREQDMKNQEGQAEGSEKADVDIQGQEQGSEELVDNQQQDQEKRKKNNHQPESQQEDGDQNEEKSDWQDNNQQGEKINKQNARQIQSEQQNGDEISENEDNMKSEQGQVSQNGQEDENSEKISEQKSEKEPEDEIQEEGNKEVDMISEEINEEKNDEQKDQEKQRKVKNRKTNIEAYGRTDLKDNNPLKNEQNAQIQPDQSGAEAQGGSEGKKGSGNPLHSLSAELIEQIMNLERKTAHGTFKKDLNVMIHDQQCQQNKDKDAEQYELGEADQNIVTNLPGFLEDNEKQKNAPEQQSKRNKEEKSEEKKEEKDNSNKGEKQQTKEKSQNKPETNQTNSNEKNLSSELQKQKYDQKQKKNEQKVKKESSPQKVELKNEDFYKNIVQKVKVESNCVQIMEDENEQRRQHILEEATEISKLLQQQLKSVLEPMDVAEYRGDYKTGKKLNLKKIIPFIASNYRKDRIWLRRTEPSERNYFIMLALDDTKSMHYGDVGAEAMKGLLAISLALQSLSIKTCITSIKDTLHMIKPFTELLAPSSVMDSFGFNYESSISHDLSIASFVGQSLKEFQKTVQDDGSIENKQLCFIISDGKMNKDYVRPYMKEAKKKDITYVFIIVDSLKDSILGVKSVRLNEMQKTEIKSYLSDFPFDYFLIVKNVRELGEVLASTLLQFIQEK